MITDTLENIDKYGVSSEVKEFLRTLTSKTPEGHYEINESSFANIDCYQTKATKDCRFEAHKKYIDIQMLLSGEEELDYTNVSGLEVTQVYDEKSDVMFFNAPKNPDTIRLVSFKFVLLYPHEAHRPQMNCDGNSSSVKKVVVKILA